MSRVEDFDRNFVYEGVRTMIRSVCPECGAWTIASHIDGSLEEWERAHDCRNTTAPVQRVAKSA